MVEVFNKKLTKDDIVASPCDEVLTGVITKIEKGLLGSFVDEKVHSKFDNLDQETLMIYFETKFNDMIIKGSDRLAYYEKPMTNSKLGKFLLKYGSLEAGQQIKIVYNSEGFGRIKVD